MTVNYQCKSFSELTTLEFYEFVKLRIEVFVVEQNCPYQEVDQTDVEAYHSWLADENGQLLAYSRMYLEDDSLHIGRVLVHPRFRRQGLGETIMVENLAYLKEHHPKVAIDIQAQEYVQEFYQSLGFQPTSEVYLEDDIPHLDMRLQGEIAK